MKKFITFLFLMLTFVLVGCNTVEPVASADCPDAVWVIEPQFLKANMFKDGVAAVQKTDGAYFFTNKSGRNVFDAEFSGISSNNNFLQSWGFRNGVARVDSDGTTRTLSRSGIMIDYERIQTSKVDRTNATTLYAAQDSETEKWGYVNKQEMWFVEPQFDFSLGFINDFSIGYNGNDGYLVSAKGEVKQPSDFNKYSRLSYHDGIGVTHSLYSSKAVFYDISGNILFTGEYEDVRVFGEGYCAVKLDGQWGYVDNTGAIRVEPQYTKAYEFSDGLAMVEDSKGNVGFIDHANNVVIPFENALYNSTAFSNGLIVRIKYGKYGLMNLQSEWVLNARYDNIFVFKSYIELRKGDKYGVYLDAVGVTIEPKFSRITRVADNALLLEKQNSYFVLDLTSGELSDAFNYLGNYGEGLLVAQRKKGEPVGYVDVGGRWMIPPVFADAGKFSEGVAAVQTTDRLWGYIANPCVYNTWSDDETQRAVSLGLISEDLTTQNKIDVLLSAATRIIFHVTDEELIAKDLYEKFDLQKYNITQETELTREHAAIIAALTAEYCGSDIYCLLGFLLDYADVDENSVSFVNYAVCSGYFEFAVNGVFEPKKSLTTDDLAKLVLRLYEDCLS